MSSLHGSIQCWGMQIVQRSCCVCVQVGRRKYENPSLVWMWFHCGWVENWLWSATAVGGGWWVRRPTVGEETRWWVLPQAMPGQLLLLLQRWSEPATILTPILPSPYLPMPACLNVCFLLVYLFKCFSVGLVFYFSQLPKLSGCVSPNFSFGYIEFRSWAFWDLFLQKGFQHKIKFLKFMFFTLFSKTKWTVELLPWHEIFSCGAGHNVWTGRFDVVLHLMPHFFDVVFLRMPHFHFLRTSFLFLSCSHFLFGAMSVLWSAPRFISSFVA